MDSFGKMSATNQMRAMLDELMGTTRNGEGRKLRFSDERVCKSFLLGCCPHDLLASTRMDLGRCPKVHDLAFRADYEIAAQRCDFYYDIKAMEHLQAFLSDCDRRTEEAKQRLSKTQETLGAVYAEKANVVHALEAEIGQKLAKAEALGIAGEVEASVALMRDIDDLKVRKSNAELDYRNAMPASLYQQQKLRVCEVCSAFLGIREDDIRLSDHFGGKLHLSFLEIREKLAELEKTAGPRKAELLQSDKKEERYEDMSPASYFVGARELHRRSYFHSQRPSVSRRRSRRSSNAENINEASRDGNGDRGDVDRGSGDSSGGGSGRDGFRDRKRSRGNRNHGNRNHGNRNHGNRNRGKRRQTRW